MMQIALVEATAIAQLTVEPLGLAYISSYLKKNDIDNKMFFYAQSEDSFNKILSYRPQLIGLSMYLENYEIIRNFCRKIKNCLEDVKICVGGHFPTSYKERILHDIQDIDFVVCYEGEYAFYNLIQTLQSGGDLNSVENLIYRKADTFVANVCSRKFLNLDELPFPNRQLFVKNGIFSLAQISTSRGCTKHCSFCSCHRFWKSWRGRSIGNVVEEMEQIIAEKSIRLFGMVDSSFEDPGISIDKLNALSQILINKKLGILYLCYFRADIIRKLTEPDLARMVESGLFSVFFGVETGNEEDRVLYNKTADISEGINAIRLFQKYPLNVSIGFINFNPYTTLDKLRLNIEFLSKIDMSYYKYIYSRYIAYYGTELYEKLLSDELITTEKIGEQDNYRFVRPEIKKLYDGIEHFFTTERNKSIQNIAGKLQELQEVALVVLRLYGEQAPLLEEQIQKTLPNIKALFQSFNKVNELCFLELLHESDTFLNPDPSSILRIFNDHYNDQMLNQFDKDYNMLNYRFCLMIKKHAPKHVVDKFMNRGEMS